MYHDQGHVALKTLGFDHAVNVTLGLPIVRTSVAHGTAYDIAWSGKARTSSLVEAVRVAAQFVLGRREQDERTTESARTGTVSQVPPARIWPTDRAGSLFDDGADIPGIERAHGRAGFPGAWHEFRRQRWPLCC